MKPGIHQSVRSLKMIAVMVAIAVLITASAVVAATTATRYYVPNEYLIHVRPGTDSAAVQDAVSRMGYTLVKGAGLANYYLIRLGRSGAVSTPARSNTILSRAASTNTWVIDRIQPNYLYYVLDTPTDPNYDYQWNMDLIHMPEAWSEFGVGPKGSSSVVVAVVDTGVDFNHPELENRCIVPGFDAITPGGDGMDLPLGQGTGHGTHVAGIIAAQGNAGDVIDPVTSEARGIVGVCWDGVRILPVRVMAPNGSGSTTDIISGLDYCLGNNVNVVNMSLGGPPNMATDPAFRAKVVELDKAGIIVVASAGNSGETADHYTGPPGIFPEVICVGSVGPNDEIAPYSSWGPGYSVDIAAPGGDSSVDYANPDPYRIYSTYVTWQIVGDYAYPTHTYAFEEGTSMAAPHVAGAAALLLSQGVPAREVKSRLMDTAREPAAGIDPQKYGAGVLDVKAALSNASIKIKAPVKGSAVGSSPVFSFNYLGVNTSTIRVYMDYADDNGDGIPTNEAVETPLVANVSPYIDTTHRTINFSLADLGKAPLTSGTHYLYVRADPMAGGVPVYDWAVFTVSGRKITRGLHLISFPYVFYRSIYNSETGTSVSALTPPLLTEPDDPAHILKNCNFSPTSSSRSVLKRWVPKYNDYVSYYPGGTMNDLLWKNPIDSGVRSGGGFFPSVGGFPGDESYVAEAPAGSGYWLIVPQDTYIDESYPTLEYWPLESDNATPCASAGYNIPLYTGWNMIGNPYAHAIPWASAKFSYQNDVKDLQGAVDAGWIKLPFYGYNPTGNAGYVTLDSSRRLEPFEGYWLRANVGTADQYHQLYMIVQP